MPDKTVNSPDGEKSRGSQTRRRPVWEAGGLVDETKVSLCVYGENLVPDELTQAFGLEPTHAHRKGDPIKSGSPHIRKQGAWIFSICAEAPEDPDKITNILLDKLPQDGAVWTGTLSRYRVVLRYGLFVDAWVRGFDLSNATLKRIAEANAELCFNIYSTPNDE